MDRKLLLAILKTHDYSFDAEAVAKDLSTDGETLTSNAIRKRIKRIREMVKGVPDTKRYACAKLIILFRFRSPLLSASREIRIFEGSFVFQHSINVLF